MTYHIGIQGVQSGPFSEADLRDKLARGDFPPDALCWAEGWPGWRPLSTVFADATMPPPMPAVSAPAFPSPPPVSPSSPATTSGLAITSLVLGISGLMLLFTAIPAVICGHLACSQIKDSAGARKGRGLAIAGLVLGYLIISLIPVGLLAAMAIPAFQKVRTVSQEKAIINNLRQLDAASSQFMLEKGVTTATYADLVGAGERHYIRVLPTIAGEDYTHLVIRESDASIDVTTGDGRVITHPRLYVSPKGTLAPGGPP